MTETLHRLRLMESCLLAAAVLTHSGCGPDSFSDSQAEQVWGSKGIGPGRFLKPRAAAIDDKDRLYIVDMTARIQVFDRSGAFLNSWQTPQSKNGRPSGLTVTENGRLLVADTHYFRVLVYTLDGKLLEEEILGGEEGQAPGQFGFVTDAVQDSAGNYYVSQYGEYPRIQKFSPQGEYLLQWGSTGSEPGQFRRPQNLAVDADDRLWVADACNHRIQVFAPDGTVLDVFGEQGDAEGQLSYPYDLALDGQGHLYVCEYGNHRVQKFTTAGQSLGCWGSEGRGDGQLFNPWALVLDHQGDLHVVDSNNHRVQRVRM